MWSIRNCTVTDTQLAQLTQLTQLTQVTQLTQLEEYSHKMVDGSVRYQFTVVQFQFPELCLARVAATQIPQPLVTDPLAVT